MMIFSILTTVAFGLFFIAMIARLYGNKLIHKKGKKGGGLKHALGSNSSFATLITAGIACLIVAVWL